MLQDITNLQVLRSKSKKPIDSTKYKTEMCRNWVETNTCQYSDKCNFAHGFDELIDKNPSNEKYKSKKCIPFYSKGVCTYGQRCLFLHETRTLDEIPRSFYKAKSCWDPLPQKRLPVFERITQKTSFEYYFEKIVKGQINVDVSSKDIQI
ncbi:hypothetical protein SteCoe_4183 [Stentor coeruleus]|uniref:C3H1-type domain-containing protein n=1 Tax=Stentor coeruleus TaxID=5963 RepID=A0A1R2CVC5_9CILI|nr:hypothetical protein SteCoe_4183 [Stentor coeruleus]